MNIVAILIAIYVVAVFIISIIVGANTADLVKLSDIDIDWFMEFLLSTFICFGVIMLATLIMVLLVMYFAMLISLCMNS